MIDAAGGPALAGNGPVAVPDGRPLVFVTVGTDHHPFHRLIRWVDGWLESGAGDRVRCFVQYGTSAPPLTADHRAYLAYEEMERSIAASAAVVCHGGPGSVMMCRWLGKRPIVVPRRHDLGEHVDDHQVAFSRRMSREGEMDLAETEERFRGLLESAMAEGARVSGAADQTQLALADSLRRFEALVDRLLVPAGGRARQR